MPLLQRSAVVPLPLEEAWEALYGNEMQNMVRLSDAVVAVRDYRIREDGTPEFVMVNKSGPMKMSHRSDYLVYEPPHRSVDESVETPLLGKLYVEHTPVDEGTRVEHRFEAQPRGLMRLLFPLIRSKAAKEFQADLDTIVERLKVERLSGSGTDT